MNRRDRDENPPDLMAMDFEVCSQCHGVGYFGDMVKIGRCLSESRRYLGISHERVARVLKISRMSLCHKELGRRRWAIGELEAYQSFIIEAHDKMYPPKILNRLGTRPEDSFRQNV